MIEVLVALGVGGLFGGFGVLIFAMYLIMKNDQRMENKNE